MIVLGSKAMLTLLGETDSERFHKKDIDVVMSYTDFKSFVQKNKSFIKSLTPKTAHKYSAVLLSGDKKINYEIELDTLGSVKWLIDNKSLIEVNNYTDPFGNDFAIPNMEILYLTKRSHIFMPIHHEKNIIDYQRLRDNCNLDEAEKYKDYYSIRNAEAIERSPRKSPSLSMTNDEFFDRSADIVGYVFIHDDIHEAVKHYEKPVYEMIKRDFESAWCEKDMFFNLPHEYQISCVQEEAYVIALERYLILRKGNYNDFFQAYKDALTRICTTLCSGFFREFAVNNYNEIVKKYNSNYVQKFKCAVENGLVRKMDHVHPLKFEIARDIVFKL